MTSLRKLKNDLANSYLVIICNKSFTQLAWDKNEKVRQFAGRLEQKYKYLKEKFPDKYKTKDLKDRLFHGMHPHICKSMRFLYKKPKVTYKELLSETLEAEKDCCSSKSTCQVQSSYSWKWSLIFSTKTNRRNKCPHHSGEICLYGDPQDKNTQSQN